MRDTAISGMVTLAGRPEWQSSDVADSISGVLAAAQNDDSPVVRMYAAHAARFLRSDQPAEQRIGELGEWLLAEDDPVVQSVLLGHLRSETHVAPFEVDEVLATWAPGPFVDKPMAERQRSSAYVALVMTLAIVDATSWATGKLDEWIDDLGAHGPEVASGVHVACRSVVVPVSEVVLRVFAFLSDSVDRAAELIGAVNDHLADVTERDRETVTQAYRIVDDVADGMRRAVRGAEDEVTAVSAEDARAALLPHLLPILTACAKSGLPPTLHAVTETLVFLAPVDEKLVLRTLANIVARDSTYTGDSLAAGAVVPYLRRLLAEERDLVLYDEEGLAAFGRLLASFAAAGSEEALSMAYSFSEVFR